MLCGLYAKDDSYKRNTKFISDNTSTYCRKAKIDSMQLLKLSQPEPG